MVGVTRFKRATSCSQSTRSNLAELHPESFSFVKLSKFLPIALHLFLYHMVVTAVNILMVSRTQRYQVSRVVIIAVVIEMMRFNY